MNPFKSSIFSKRTSQVVCYVEAADVEGECEIESRWVMSKCFEKTVAIGRIMSELKLKVK